MKKLILISILLMILPAGLLAAPMGQSAGHDLDQLWAQAQASYDLEIEDAVLLLESRQVALTWEGALQTRVHRVVWIGTAVGIRSYADLRVPWNSATSTLDVEILRTWRQDPGQKEGRWWPDAEKISDTAVVETLPYAVDKADDYTKLRETMLLHDGVELGCIMETAYTITERDVPAAGGVFVMPQNDPAVLCELRVMAASGPIIQHEELNGAAAPQSLNPKQGQGLLWSAQNLPALKKPVTGSPEAYEKAVVWSTWESWDAVAAAWMTAFQATKMLDTDQADLLQQKINPALSRQQTVAAVASYLNEMTRAVHYGADLYRFAPRLAARTLATAYGHDLDRAVLAAALLQAAGLESEPMLIGRGAAWVAPDIPRLQGLSRIVLRLPMMGVSGALLDPADGQVKAFDEVFGHPFYYIGGRTGGGSGVQIALPQPEKKVAVGVSLSQGEEGTWTGEGYFHGDWVFSHYGSIMAGDDLLQGPLSGLTAGLVPGSTLTAASPVILQDGLVEATFTLEAAALEKDAYGRKVLVLGRPAGGLLDKLPGDVHLFEAERQTPVLGVGGWQQTVTVRLEVAEDQLLHRPEPRQLANAAGSFSLGVDYRDGWLTLTRSLQLAPGENATLPANLWPELRVLLLEEDDAVNGTVILK